MDEDKKVPVKCEGCEEEISSDEREYESGDGVTLCKGCAIAADEDFELEDGKVFRMDLKYFCPACGLLSEDYYHSIMGKATDIDWQRFCKHCGIKHSLVVKIEKESA